VPDELRGVVLDIRWDRERLHALDGLASLSVALEELRWQLDLPWWRDGRRPFAVRPADVAANPGAHAEHWTRLWAADVDCPIHLVRRGDGRLIVLDGMHRLLRAQLEGRSVIQALILDPVRLADITVNA
jgi:hypothetical protein